MASISLSDEGGGFTRELIEPGLYLAICCQMIQIGTIKTTWQGTDKEALKVRIGWELPEVRQVFKPELGEQPRIISKQYTASLHENAALRADLKSWRGQDFTPEELKKFELTNLLKKPCMLNIGHKLGSDGKTYEEITAITRTPKGYPVPELETPVKLLTFDDFDYTLFDALPDFIKDKIKSSKEYQLMRATVEAPDPVYQPSTNYTEQVFGAEVDQSDPLPF